MSETTTEAPAETTETEQPTQGEPAEQLGDGGKKALKAERDRANDLEKQLKQATSQLSQLQQANETEAQRLQREAQEARDALPKGITEAFREAAVTFGGIAAEDAELFLTGSDKETLQKQAARLMERTPAGPAPDPSQGGSGGAAPAALNSDQLERDLKDKLGIS